LINYIGGKTSFWFIRFFDCPSIPSDYKWSPNVDDGYDNGSTTDYLAEAFAYSIFDPKKLPNNSVGYWIANYIVLEMDGLAK